MSSADLLLVPDPHGSPSTDRRIAHAVVVPDTHRFTPCVPAGGDCLARSRSAAEMA
jgi:hypothetical protein